MMNTARQTVLATCRFMLERSSINSHIGTCPRICQPSARFTGVEPFVAVAVHLCLNFKLYTRLACDAMMQSLKHCCHATSNDTCFCCILIWLLGPNPYTRSDTNMGYPKYSGNGPMHVNLWPPLSPSPSLLCVQCLQHCSIAARQIVF